MLHPSYTDLMNVVNAEAVENEHPVVNSRYSIVMATSKRARQITQQFEDEKTVTEEKPVLLAIDEIKNHEINLLEPDEDEL